MQASAQDSRRGRWLLECAWFHHHYTNLCSYWLRETLSPAAVPPGPACALCDSVKSASKGKRERERERRKVAPWGLKSSKLLDSDLGRRRGRLRTLGPHPSGTQAAGQHDLEMGLHQ